MPAHVASRSMNTRVREIHGLVRHLRLEYGSLERRPSGRELIGALLANVGEARTGRCVWCDQPVPSKAFRWHRPCALAHATARGQTVALTGTLLPWRGAKCAKCGGGKGEWSLTTMIALGLAARIWTPWIVVRAWSRWNLQWLCRPCHLAKTNGDRWLMREWDRDGWPESPTLGPRRPPLLLFSAVSA